MHVESRAENRRGNLPRHHYERLTGIVLDLEIGLAIHFHTAFVSEQGRIDNACASIESHAGTVGQHHVRFYPQRRRNAYGLRGSNQTVLGVKSTQQPAAADSACRHDRSRSVTRNPQAQSPAGGYASRTSAHTCSRIPSAMASTSAPTRIPSSNSDSLRRSRSVPSISSNISDSFRAF